MKIFGHRGARGLAAENTLEGIEAALQAGVDGIEIDARVTSDQVVVLAHDPYLVDNSARRWYIRQHTYAFLKERVQNLATLQEAISNTPASTELRIEIKPEEPIQPFIKLLRDIAVRDRVASVISFDYAILKSLHEEIPELQLIVNERWSSIRARLRAQKLDTKRIQMNQRWLWRWFLRAMRKSGYLITPYTVNNPRQARRWQRYVEGVITDYPDRMQKLR